MIRRGIATIFILIGLAQLIAAQPNHIASKNLTIDDLKPKIDYARSSPFYQPVREKPGYALLSSAIIPGSGQAANKKWIRAGLYFLAEAVLVGVHIKSYRNAQTEQRRYEQFADNNWSVVTYAQWLVDYHEQNNLSNPYIDKLEQQVYGETAAYDTEKDWNTVDIELLRNVERNTPFVYPGREIGNDFSHVMPDYGSQQYYELISKYYQYGGGWNDFGINRDGDPLTAPYQLNWDGTGMPFNFMRGARLAEDFNDSYRLAGNMVSLIILNHIVSAFDAFLSVKIKNSRLKADTNFLHPERTVSLKFHF